MKEMFNREFPDFEGQVAETLKSLGYLFPETDEQMEIFESTVELKEVPEEFTSSSFVYLSKKKTGNILSVQHANTEGERNWAIAARDGGKIPEDIRQKMRKDKETARKETNGDK